MSSAASLKPTTIALIVSGVLATSLVGYAIYFDHRRQTDPEFRKRLKRESKKQARAAKEEAEAAGAEQRKAIREAVDKVNEQGLPKDPEEVEQYFMQEVAHGEQLCQDGKFLRDSRQRCAEMRRFDEPHRSC
jgi:mitochondrial import receptor subunit TOM20